MGTIETLRSGYVDLPPLVATDALCRVAEQQGIRVARVDSQQADLRRGSQAAIRLKGARLVKPPEIPVVAAVRFEPTGQGAFVNIRCVDDLGFGVRLGGIKRMTVGVEEFGDLVLLLAVNLTSALGRPANVRTWGPGATANCPSGHPNGAQSSFCVTCGRALVESGPPKDEQESNTP